MKKITIQITTLALMIGISACQKETNSVQVNEPKTISEQEALQKFGTVVQKNLTRTYEYGEKKLTLTYNLTDKGKMVINQHTEDNDFIYNLLRTQENLSVLYYGSDETPKIFNNTKETDIYIDKRNGYYRPKNEVNTLKTSTTNARMSFFTAPNFAPLSKMSFSVDYPWVLGGGYLGSIPYSQSKYFKNALGYTYTKNGNFLATENSWVGGGSNDIAESCIMEAMGSLSGSLSWSYGLFRLFEHINFGGQTITRAGNDAQFPKHLMNMNIDILSNGFWYNTYWNDEMSSYAAIIY